jgi:hypothetical protein
MPFDPDTEIQYRKGGKIMKKIPRKFQTGGTTTSAPTPAPKPAPKRITTPSDQPDPETAAKMRQQLADEKADRDNATGYKNATAPDRLKKPFKAGGKISKFVAGGGIESKGKTAGEIVKMAKGGSVRGYGISKVTNKTKYC